MSKYVGLSQARILKYGLEEPVVHLRHGRVMGYARHEPSYALPERMLRVRGPVILLSEIQHRAM